MEIVGTDLKAMFRISGLRNDMNKRTFYKERKINNRCFDFLSKQNIIVPLIPDFYSMPYFSRCYKKKKTVTPEHYSSYGET